ncbi:hypothetical protein EII34_09535 [Arachnia propionica]|uniref:Uncharacterized protein n=1 Tax=Arachnia propionica TaxID=1750 RepID=A0A3P1T5B1_9ACTN|nr:hypothetical protein [Arachnia propionica]RRD04540.1 hypothetical protein EII34_09535 [Arachnia propionica]
MTFDQPREVVIRHVGFGAVMIGEEPVAPAGAVTLDIFGATLELDPSRPDRLPSCLVADPGLAVPVLEQLYGNAVADEVLERALHRDDTHVTCPVVAQPSLALLIRLAENRWCQRNAALPLDPALLLLEEMTLLAELRGIVETDDDWLSDLQQLLGALMSRPVAVGAAMAQPAVRALLTRALDLLIAETSPLSDAHATAVTWAHGIESEASTPRSTGVVDWAGQLRPELALAAGGATVVGTSTVDWQDIPLGLVSRREGNVSWQVEQGDGSGRVTVTVEGTGEVFRLLGAAPNPPGGMLFDVLAPGWPMPIATGGLTRSDDGGPWSGVAELSGEQVALANRLVGDGARLDVRVRGAGPSPQRNPLVAEAERWCARAVCALRLRNVVADLDLLGSAEAALEQAMGLWALAERPAEHDATRELLELALADAGEWTETLTVAETILVAEQA